MVVTQNTYPECMHIVTPQLQASSTVPLLLLAATAVMSTPPPPLPQLPPLPFTDLVPALLQVRDMS